MSLISRPSCDIWRVSVNMMCKAMEDMRNETKDVSLLNAIRNLMAYLRLVYTDLGLVMKVIKYHRSGAVEIIQQTKCRMNLRGF